MRRVVLFFLATLLTLCAFATTASAEKYERIYTHPDALVDHPDGTGFIVYLTPTTKEHGVPRATQSVVRDETDMIIVVESTRSAKGYSECYKWALSGSGDPVVGHGCYDWLDEAKHEIAIATPEQAKQFEKLSIHAFRVVGDPPTEWTGEENPEGTLMYSIAHFNVVSAEEGAKELKEAFTFAVVSQAVDKGAKKILRCAHPTGKYHGVMIDRFEHHEKGMTMNFSIDYKCRLTNRPCELSVEAEYTPGGELLDLKVVKDTAKTNPEVGLKACEAVLKLLKR